MCECMQECVHTYILVCVCVCTTKTRGKMGRNEWLHQIRETETCN